MHRLAYLLAAIWAACILSAVSSFRIINRSIYRSGRIFSNRPDINDFDSSELNYGSSNDYKAALKNKMLLEEKAQADSKIVVGDNKKLSTTLSSAGSGFDIGLLIAFPVIVGTLGLFFVFPLLTDSLNKSLPPPMSY